MISAPTKDAAFAYVKDDHTHPRGEAAQPSATDVAFDSTLTLTAANQPVTTQVLAQQYSQCLPVPNALQRGICDSIGNGVPRPVAFDRFSPMMPEPVRVNIAEAIDQGLPRDRAYDIFAPLTRLDALNGNVDRHPGNRLLGHEAAHVTQQRRRA